MPGGDRQKSDVEWCGGDRARQRRPPPANAGHPITTGRPCGAGPRAVAYALMTMRLGPTRFHIGTQGWNYPAWVGPVYPRTARSADFLPLYARLFDTVEVDSTFYAVPSAATIENWARRAPATFRFALKFPREATHDALLAGPSSQETLERFVERVRPLGPRLGPILIQLPAEFGPKHRDTLDAFVDLLPPDLQFAVELRHTGWMTTDVWESLAARRVAATLTDSPFVPLADMLGAYEEVAYRTKARSRGRTSSMCDGSGAAISRTTRTSSSTRAPISRAGRPCCPLFSRVGSTCTATSTITTWDIRPRRLGRSWNSWG